MRLKIGDIVIEHHNFITLNYRIVKTTPRKATGVCTFEGKDYPVVYRRRYKKEHGIHPWGMPRRFWGKDPVIREVYPAKAKKK